jgi:ubiquinone/menaquinone biosynthesis C-methylase UbiE
MPSIGDVKAYWERHPLLSYEVGEVSPEEHWQQLDHLKRSDIERFSAAYWNFDGSVGRKLLDIGCGPGWLTVTYASAGAFVTAVDLTETAVLITKKVLESKSLKAHVEVANAELLPFDDASFDIVVSSGVLHHTPNTMKAFTEAFRVTRPGGTGLITLYRLGALHHPAAFPLVRVAMRITGTRHPGANLAVSANSVEEFVRQYDGEQNPLGIAQSERAWRRALESVGWVVERTETHYFPLRMVSALSRAPEWLHRVFDRWFGTMVYFTLTRPSA